jgi:hypothetical protein
VGGDDGVTALPEPTTSGALTMPDTVPGSSHTITGHVERGWFQHLQALQDAIAYRRARVTAPCPDCTAIGHRCDDHACDLDLIADYQQAAIAAIRDVPSRIDASQPCGSPLAAPRR